MCGFWATPAAIASGLAQILADNGFTDCAPNVWEDSECPTDKARLWSPLPPPGYSPFERFLGKTRPSGCGPFEYMLQSLQRVVVDKYYSSKDKMYKYAPSGTIDRFLHFVKDCRLSNIEFAAALGLSCDDFESLRRYVQDAYTLEYTRRFGRTFFDKSRRLHQAGHHVCSMVCRRYVLEYLDYCRGYVSPQPVSVEEMAQKRHFIDDMKSLFIADEPCLLSYVCIYFGDCWARISPMPIRPTNGELGTLLSKLTPIGRTYVAEFFNETGYVPSFIYAEWVLGYESIRLNPELKKHFNPFKYVSPLIDTADVEASACVKACKQVARGPVILSSLIERNQVHLNFSERDTEVIVPIDGAKPQAPTLSWNMMPNGKSIVHTGSQIYYRESRDGVVRHIPLTRYPMNSELETPAFRSLVEKAFATPTDVYAPSSATSSGPGACLPSGSVNADWLAPKYSETAGGSAFTNL